MASDGPKPLSGFSSASPTAPGTGTGLGTGLDTGLGTGLGTGTGPPGSRCLGCGMTWDSAHFQSLSAFHSSVRQHQRICQDIMETDSDCSVHSSDRSDIEVSSGEEIPHWPSSANAHGGSGPGVSEEETEDEMPQECDNCGREFDDEPQFKDHVLYCPKRYKCVLCPCPPLTWDVFQTHVLSHPSEDDEHKLKGTSRPSSASAKRALPSEGKRTSIKRNRPYPNPLVECKEPARGPHATGVLTAPIVTSNFNHGHALHEGNKFHSHHSKLSDATSQPPISTPCGPFMAQCDVPRAASASASASPKLPSLLSESINHRDEAPHANPTTVTTVSNRCEGSYSFQDHMT